MRKKGRVKSCSKLEFALRYWKDEGASTEMGKAGNGSQFEMPITHQMLTTIVLCKSQGRQNPFSLRLPSSFCSWPTL